MNHASQASSQFRLLLVDDNDNFRQTLATALGRRGHRVAVAACPAEALIMLERHAPERVILDLNLGEGDGLDLIPRLLELQPELAIVVLTGYASIATAVAAIRLGAIHYLAKPASVDEVLSAFERTAGDATTALPNVPMSLNQLEWEHLQRTLHEQNGNISAAARALGMHRRSLQRKLRKHARW